MRITNLTEEKRALIDYLEDKETIPLIENQLTSSYRKGTKTSVAVAFGLISKATLFTQEMGIGKTFVAMGLIENILRNNPNKKIIFCGTNDKLLEYVRVFKENLSPQWGVTSTTAAESKVRKAFQDLDNGYRILICTHSVWDMQHYFHKELIPRLDQFQGFILDEGGLLLGNNDNYSYRMMENFVPNMEYRYILNATPIEKDLTLLLNQCRVLGIPIPSKSKIFSQYGSITDEQKWVFGDLKGLSDRLKYHIFNLSRSDLGIEVEYEINPIYFKVPREVEMLVKEDNIRSVRYPFLQPDKFTHSLYPCLKALIIECRVAKSKGEKVLVYIRNVSPKIAIKKELEEIGITVGIYDGTHTDTHEKKSYVETLFNNGEYDVLLTNKIYGLSLTKASHVITYDIPSSLHQFAYRAIRDLKSKSLKITLMIYDTPNDYNSLMDGLNSERYQNEFSGREFKMVETIVKKVQIKAKNKIYGN